ncbi:MAG TPA: urease accessory UreF family protein [Vicinamibacterales bacterium]
MSGNLVALLHLCDSLFPIGSFAHSDGLEAATATGEIQTVRDLRSWMEVTLTETLRRIEGPAVARAWDAATHLEPALLARIDDEVYALRPSSTARESTRAMGTRLLKTWQQIRPHESAAITRLERPHLTLPVAFGVVAAASDIGSPAAIEGFIYTRLASTISAAMRLMPLGQRDGHELLAGTLARVPALAEAIATDDSPLGGFTPMLDVTVMSQQYVESRLFKS